MSDLHSILLVAVISLVTMGLRFLPFWLFGTKDRTPRFITYLGKVLPPAMIAMLVVYCLKQVSLVRFPFGLPELFSILLVAVLHLWKHNTLLSVGCGTLCYMVLVQTVFSCL